MVVMSKKRSRLDLKLELFDKTRITFDCTERYINKLLNLKRIKGLAQKTMQSVVLISAKQAERMFKSFMNQVV